MLFNFNANSENIGTKKVKEVNLIFENVQWNGFPVEAIKRFEIGRFSGNFNKNELKPTYTASEFSIVLDYLYDVYPDKDFFEIHAHRDITHVDIIYDDESEDRFSIAWEDGSVGGEINAFQTSKMNKRGDLFIVVSRNPARFDEIFPESFIEATAVFTDYSWFFHVYSSFLKNPQTHPRR
jgi:hypothetical protein